MKHVQGIFFTGYITISVKGTYPEQFFEACRASGITVWDIKKINNEHCIGNIKRQAITQVEQLKENTYLQVSYIKEAGLPFLFQRLLKKRELIIAAVVSIILIFVLSNILWSISIKGVSTEVEEKIYDHLNSYGIHKGSWSFTLDSPSSIQQQLMNDIPELLWVGVHKQGTTYHLEGVEKVIVKEEEPNDPQHLVAAKKGVIKKMYVEKGLPLVEVNDYVEAGDILVSGIVNEEDLEEEADEDTEEKDAKEKIVVPSEGTVTATTWYEIDVSIPLDESHELLTGRQKNKYRLKIGDLQLPIWGFKDPPFKHIHQEDHDEPIRFLKWDLPISIVKTVLNEKMYNKKKRSLERAKELGIEQAKKELSLTLDEEAKIISQNVLHESLENDKVKLIIYVTVEENIAKAEPINQGD